MPAPKIAFAYALQTIDSGQLSGLPETLNAWVEQLVWQDIISTDPISSTLHAAERITRYTLGELELAAPHVRTTVAFSAPAIAVASSALPRKQQERAEWVMAWSRASQDVWSNLRGRLPALNNKVS